MRPNSARSIVPEIVAASLEKAEAEIGRRQEEAAEDVRGDGDPDRDVTPVDAAQDTRNREPGGEAMRAASYRHAEELHRDEAAGVEVIQEEVERHVGEEARPPHRERRAVPKQQVEGAHEAATSKQRGQRPAR